MLQSNLNQLSIQELKQLCRVESIEPCGDRRLKATWILAIESAAEQTQSISPLKVDPLPDENLDPQPILAAPSLTTPVIISKVGHKDAAAFALVVTLLLSIAALIVCVIVWLISKITHSLSKLWLLAVSPKTQLPIDYFPILT